MQLSFFFFFLPRCRSAQLHDTIGCLFLPTPLQSREHPTMDFIIVSSIWASEINVAGELTNTMAPLAYLLRDPFSSSITTRVRRSAPQKKHPLSLQPGSQRPPITFDGSTRAIRAEKYPSKPTRKTCHLPLHTSSLPRDPRPNEQLCGVILYIPAGGRRWGSTPLGSQLSFQCATCVSMPIPVCDCV
ncbi:hypothetical protein BX600DRAFT_277712 [Xylariales sp. PMI_506]|nr:hypothetical protein BX600DRAFT_277712 [Xylariales sp. PMI_506]